MKILEIRHESPDIFEIHEFEDISDFNFHKKSHNIINTLKKKALWLLLLFIVYGYFYYMDFIFTNFLTTFIYAFIFIFYIVIILIYKPVKPGHEYLFILDKTKKEFIIEGIGKILVINPHTQKAELKNLANTDDDKLKLSLNQTLLFELIKIEDNPTLNNKFNQKYGRDFVEKVKDYELLLCLKTRNYKDNVIELYKSKAFSELSPLEDGILERWENVTEKLNRFLNS
jgi:hypothetical protein